MAAEGAAIDLCDILAELGYGLELKTRNARADAFDQQLTGPSCRFTTSLAGWSVT